MTPTPRLRFVEREVKLDPFIMSIGNAGLRVTPAVQVLQQWWIEEMCPPWDAKPGSTHGMWRDVPVEKETPS